MDVELAAKYRNTARGKEAEQLLAACVQCGQCTFICPTFRLFNEEWDGPRGRIFLIKKMLEQEMPSAASLSPAYSLDALRKSTIGANVQERLDRCLSCRSCEAKCPNGVRYGRLLDIGREIAEEEVGRPLGQRLARRALRAVIPYRRRFSLVLKAGQVMRRALPRNLRVQIPPKRTARSWPTRAHARRMVLWQGCVQPALAPNINAAAARVLDRLGIQAIPASDGCCGAISQHLAQPDEASRFMRRSIDALWPHVVEGVEAVIVTASGCGAHVREYDILLREDRQYAEKAKTIARMTKDIAEVVADAWKPTQEYQAARDAPRRIAFLSSCSLQHNLKINSSVEQLLRAAGMRLVPVQHSFMCCGAAGTYSILQRPVSDALRTYKLKTLLAARPELIVTANIGCLTHMAGSAPVPVLHWIELLDEVLETSDPDSVLSG